MREGWKEIKLKEICEFKYGKSLPEKVRVLGDYPVYGSSGIVSYHKDYLLEGPGIIIGRKGTVGKVQYSKQNFFPIDTTFYVEEDKSKADLKFLYYRLPLSGLDTMNSDAAVPGLNRTAAINQRIVLPPLPTQRKIAKILSAYDDLIENNLNRIKLLEEMAQKTYEEWFVRMKFPGHENAKFDKETGLPEGWKKVKLGEVINVGRGSSPRPIADQKYFNGGNIPWLKIADATASHIYIYETKEYVNEYGASFSRKLPPGSLIIAASGTLGFPMFLGVECCIHDGWIYFDGIEKKMKEYFYFNFINLKEYFAAISYGAAIQNINTNILRGSPFIIPTESILLYFHKQVQPIFKQIQNLQIQNQHLKEARDILLPRLMTGMVDVDELSRKSMDESDMSVAAEQELKYGAKLND